MPAPGKQFANIADRAFHKWAGKGQINGNSAHDWTYDDSFSLLAANSPPPLTLIIVEPTVSQLNPR